MRWQGWVRVTAITVLAVPAGVVLAVVLSIPPGPLEVLAAILGG